ncbi:MAG: transcription antitermination factor NusB [Candidatus Taylorbacteria bacterium]|nr:transcription antitermination factor NusB [Candidatus Taylorbacteria bacterium]
MANRHLARSTVLQTLFEWDFNRLGDSDALGILKRNMKEFAPGLEESSFITGLLNGVLVKRPDLDKIIEKAAPEWPLEKISIVDRNILRIGLYELLFADREEVPAKVAINEAIELAKTFGGDNSGKFVNGVLGAVYKEIGEPGKADSSPRKKENDPSKYPTETLAGAVVAAVSGGETYLALVHDVFGHWTLSKGHLEAGENVKKGVQRVINEEIGLEIAVKEELGKNEYVASDPEKGKIRKQVIYFFAEAPFEELKLKKSGGLDDAAWFKLKDIVELNFYNDILPIVTKAIHMLLGKSSSNIEKKSRKK